jgi:hypothetical protein
MQTMNATDVRNLFMGASPEDSIESDSGTGCKTSCPNFVPGPVLAEEKL